MTTVFVTSTGTGIGKTFVTLKLVAELKDAGIPVRALKPVASGFEPARPEDSDTALLLRAQGLDVTPANLDLVSPFRFAASLSPDMAAAREQRSLDFDALVERCRAAADRSGGVTLIEGIGGVMVPLDSRHTVLDWIAALGAPALLVVGSYLGTLSHTLTAAAALRQRGVTLLGVVISESAEQPVPGEESAASLARFVAAPVRVLARVAPAPLLPLLEPYLR